MTSIRERVAPSGENRLERAVPPPRQAGLGPVHQAQGAAEVKAHVETLGLDEARRQLHHEEMNSGLTVAELFEQ
ncbi:hypothetical protein F9L07_19765 [Pimelobacter simplex]|uniref:Uncharacterized protein n=1 Tax=Nocardioides simplex TaxID=2045 RepID=A0A7J5DVH0_NOCSI|nr:hypothetical protein [Pimelobacter simplex]KAB2809281.1 hypothetical protein F9L07_19765 [Pimelobacter simplex]